jgi:peptide/nickel transport system substrate-binding protein
VTRLLLFLAVLASCRAAPPPHGTIRVLVANEPETLDPRFCTDPLCVKVTRLLYASLVGIDGETLRPFPDAAESITREGPQAYRIRLRHGVLFHDGREMTVDDVRATLVGAASPALGSPHRHAYERIAQIEVRGRYELLVRLSEPHATFVTDLDLPILPAEYAEKKLAPGVEHGAGPFRLVHAAAGHLVLVPFARYRGGAPRVRVEVIAVPDDNARALRLIGGGGDLAQNSLPPPLWPLFEKDRRFRVEEAPSATFTYLGMNLEDPTMRDVRVRRAIAHAIDRRALVQGKLGGRAVLATGYLPKGHWAYSADVPRYEYDPARARRLLDEAGLVDPPGPRPRATLLYRTSTDRFRLGLARAIAAMLRAVGLDVDLRASEMAVLKSDLARGRYQIFSLQIPEVIEPNMAKPFFHSESAPSRSNPEAGPNRMRYRSAVADRLIEEGRSTDDPAARRRAYAALQRVLAEDLPVVPLWHEDNVAIVRRGIRGYRMDASARLGGLLHASVAW